MRLGAERGQKTLTLVIESMCELMPHHHANATEVESPGEAKEKPWFTLYGSWWAGSWASCNLGSHEVERVWFLGCALCAPLWSAEQAGSMGSASTWQRTEPPRLHRRVLEDALVYSTVGSLLGRLALNGHDVELSSAAHLC